MAWKWLQKPSEWAAVAEAIRTQGIMGCDTETFGHNVKTSTPAFRASIDVWSLALRTVDLHPYGYHIARACVLPAAAAEYPALKSILEDPRILKVFHNAHHDEHAFANHGIHLAGVYDTLETIRLYYPERAGVGAGGYRLKPLRFALLGKPEREGFKELTSPQEESYEVQKEVGCCVCGVPKCKKRKEPHGRTVRIDTHIKVRKIPCPIEGIIPGHPRWERKLDYAGDDAADALELYEMCTQRGIMLESKLPELPWESSHENTILRGKATAA